MNQYPAAVSVTSPKDTRAAANTALNTAMCQKGCHSSWRSGNCDQLALLLRPSALSHSAKHHWPWRSLGGIVRHMRFSLLLIGKLQSMQHCCTYVRLTISWTTYTCMQWASVTHYLVRQCHLSRHAWWVAMSGPSLARFLASDWDKHVSSLCIQ